MTNLKKHPDDVIVRRIIYYTVYPKSDIIAPQIFISYGTPTLKWWEHAHVRKYIKPGRPSAVPSTNDVPESEKSEK